MKNVFTVTAPTTAITLDGAGCGESTITVTNVGATRIDGRIRIVPSGQCKIDWLTITEKPAVPGKSDARREAEGAFVPNESRQYLVRIAIPADAPAGNYQFRADAYAVDEPDETCARGPDITARVSREQPAAAKKFPLWIPIAAGVVVLLAAGIVTTILLVTKKKDEPAPAVATVTVPDLIGKPIDEARAAITAASLVEQGVTERTSGQKAGTVLEQEPKAGSTVDANTPIALVVESEAPKPVANKVPRLIDLSQDEAKKALAAAGLTLGDVIIDYAPGHKEGRVLKQNPAEGTYDNAIPAVNLVVQAASSTVPNVLRKSAADARAALERAQLKVEEKFVLASTQTTGFEPGTVLRQETAAGAQVRQGSTVVIEVVRNLKVYEPRLEAIKVQPVLENKKVIMQQQSLQRAAVQRP